MDDREEVHMHDEWDAGAKIAGVHLPSVVLR